MRIDWKKSQLIVFVIIDSSAIEIPDLGTEFTVLVSKNGEAFAAGVGTKAEIGMGWYSYELTEDETDTLGALAVVITAEGAAQQNLHYEIDGTPVEGTTGPYILSAVEAANFLRCEPDDQVMLQFLPMIDVYLENATGHNWANDDPVPAVAKSAAGMLLIAWYDHPEMVGSSPTSLLGLLVQLEAEALKYKKYTVEGLNGAGSIFLSNALEGSSVLSVTGVVGATGDQSAKFETTISEENFIKQTSADNLDEKFFVVVLKHPAEDVSG
jgi:hypothetical protein